MGISWHWDNTEETILYEMLEGDWTIEEYHGLVDEAAALLSERDHVVHVILDFTHSHRLPPNLLAGARYAEKKLPSNQGIVVFVKPDAFVKTLINIARQLGFHATEHLYMAATAEEARQVIATHAPAFPTNATKVR